MAHSIGLTVMTVTDCRYTANFYLPH